MTMLRESQAIVQKPPMVVAPIPLGFIDCFALFLSLVLMLISAVAPGRRGIDSLVPPK
jgi:hypothetical protein